MNIPYEEQIMKIELVTNVKKINKHKLDLRPQVIDVIYITLHNGNVRTLDMCSQAETTCVDFIEYEFTDKTKRKLIWEEINFEKLGAEKE